MLKRVFEIGHVTYFLHARANRYLRGGAENAVRETPKCREPQHSNSLQLLLAPSGLLLCKTYACSALAACGNMRQHATTCGNMRHATCDNMRQHAATCDNMHAYRARRHAATCGTRNMQGDSGASRFSANMRQHARCGAVQGDSGAPRATCKATCNATCGNMQGNHDLFGLCASQRISAVQSMYVTFSITRGLRRAYLQSPMHEI
jgi:hypothetical protein